MEEKSENKKFRNVCAGDVMLEIDDPSSRSDRIALLDLSQKPSTDVENKNPSFDFTEHQNILRLSTDSFLSQAITLLSEKLTLSSFIAVEVTLNHKIGEICYEDFMQIFHLLHESETKYIFAKSNDEKSKDFLLWCGQGRRQIFVLSLESEEKKISSHVRRFLLASLRSGHDVFTTGLLSSFKYEETNTKVAANIFSLGDARGFNLLLILSESGNVEAVKKLLKLGFDVHNAVDGMTAIDLAYDNKHFDVTLELLKNHSLYPENFNIEGVSDELKNFLDLSDLMHKNVIDNNEEKVLEILDANPTFKFYYNTDNNSVVTCALVRKNFKIYEHLMRRNFVFGPYEDIDGILGFLNGDEKAQRILKRIHEKHSKPLLAPHLMILISNSSMGHDNENDPEKIAAVTLAFQTLDKDPRLSQLLKVVASTRNFKITFDFERDSVRLLDPSVEGYVNGLFTTSGKILIAAKDLLVKGREHIAYGVIAHELCHFALYRTFNNDALPYAKSDEKGEKLYKTVLEYCETKKHLEEIVASAYDDYPEEMIPPEVAVRYPHMLGHYHDQPDEIADKSITFGPLKTFHEEKVMPAIEEAIERFEKNADIRGKYLNARKEISLMRNIIRGLLIVLLVSLIGAGIVVQLVKGPTKKWNDFNAEEQKIIKDNVVNYFGIEVRFGDLFDNSSAAYDALSEHQLDLAVRKCSSGLNEALNQTLHSKVVLKWENCTEGLKHKIMNSTVKFQGKKIQLRKILDYDSKPLFELSENDVKMLIEDNGPKIGSALKYGSENFIARRFKTISVEHFKPRWKSSTKKLNNLSAKNATYEAYREGLFLLTGGPGSGKSTAFKNLTESVKRYYPSYWVALVPLKDHVEAYKKSVKDESFANLIGSSILKLEGFELSVFHELYSKGKVAILWDAFDEVSSEFHGQLLSIFRNIKSQSKFMQLISTRPEHQDLISRFLSSKSFALVPFGKNDRKLFFDKQLKTLPEQEKLEIQSKIQAFIEKSETSLWDIGDRSVNNPLMLHMIAEVLKSDDHSLNLENRFEIYQKFVMKRIESIEVKRLQNLASKNLNFYDLHETFALNLFPEVLKYKKRGKINIDPKEVAALGFMTISSDGKLNFIHRTFEEFFYAHFIINKLYNMIDIVDYQEMMFRFYAIFDSHFQLDVVVDFIFDYFKNNQEIVKWDEENLEVGRKVLCNATYSSYFNIFLNDSYYKHGELLRRLLLKDQVCFDKTLQLSDENIFKWMERRFSIKAEGDNFTHEGYISNHQMGNILFRIWFHLRLGEFSYSYLINKHTGLNVDKQFLDKIKSHQSFYDFYNFIARNLTNESETIMLKSNFKEIFLNDWSSSEKDEYFWFFWQKLEIASTRTEMQKFLSEKNHVYHNIFHKIAKLPNATNVVLMLDEVENYLDPTQIKEILRRCYYTYPKTLEMYTPSYIYFPLKAACKNSMEILKSFWTFMTKYLSLDEQKHFVFCKNTDVATYVELYLTCKANEVFDYLLSHDAGECPDIEICDNKKNKLIKMQKEKQNQE